MKLNFKVAFIKEKNDLPLVKEVLSKGGFVKPAPVVIHGKLDFVEFLFFPKKQAWVFNI